MTNKFRHREVVMTIENLNYGRIYVIGAEIPKVIGVLQYFQENY